MTMMSEIEYAREQEEKRVANQKREANLPEDLDVMHISGPVPVADLSSALAVIDQERAENARLRGELAEAQQALTAKQQGSFSGSKRLRHREDPDVADEALFPGLGKRVFWVGVGVVVLLVLVYLMHHFQLVLSDAQRVQNFQGRGVHAPYAPQEKKIREY